MRVFEHHHGAAGDVVRPADAPERAQLARCVRIAPGEPSRWRRDRGGKLRPRGDHHVVGGRLPPERQVAELGKELLQPQRRALRDLPVEAARELGPRAAGQVDGHRQLDAHVDTESEAESARPEGQRVGVELPPAPRGGRREPGPGGSDHVACRIGEGQRELPGGGECRPGLWVGQELRVGSCRKPAHPCRRRQALPGAGGGGDLDRARAARPARDHAHRHDGLRSGQCPRGRSSQRDECDRRVERHRHRRPGLHLQPATEEVHHGCLDREAAPCRVPDEPPGPARPADREFDRQALTGGEAAQRPQPPLSQLHRHRRPRRRMHVDGGHPPGKAGQAHPRQGVIAGAEAWRRPGEQRHAGQGGEHHHDRHGRYQPDARAHRQPLEAPGGDVRSAPHRQVRRAACRTRLKLIALMPPHTSTGTLRFTSMCTSDAKPAAGTVAGAFSRSLRASP